MREFIFVDEQVGETEIEIGGSRFERSEKVDEIIFYNGQQLPERTR
jgi:hypothetical protein